MSDSRQLLRQILKYGLIGGLATAINIVVAEFLAAFVLPCLGVDDFFVRHFGLPASTISDDLRANYAVVCNLTGFFVANVSCWVLNRRYVFTPGRHSLFVEYLLFLAGSGVAILFGNAAIWFLVKFCAVQTTFSFAVNVILSVAINFVVRKFIVFKN